MKRILTLLILTLFLVACSAKVIPVKNEPVTQVAVNTPSNVTEAPKGNAEFKIVKQSAVRNPPAINGTVKNIGVVAGDVKVTGRVFYGGVIAFEKEVTLTNIKPDEEAIFGITVDKTVQWASYTVILEKI